MAQRTVCLCDGKYIGIETIYTVVNGQQINIPEKLQELRRKSRNNELFCPCGCGSNLILVAGDKNLREQHFRIKGGEPNAGCTAVTESKTSLRSKIVLKCWLDEKLKTADIETRVPIYVVDGVERKYEFTFLSREKKIALSYCRDRANLSDEKFEILESNSRGISIIYVADTFNGGNDGQYPEGLMKIQNRQGYCLLLDIKGKEGVPSMASGSSGFQQEKTRREKSGWKVENFYERASMDAVFYAQDGDGLWQEISIASGKLGEFEIDESGDVLFSGKLLRLLKERALYRFQQRIDAEKKRRQEQQAAYLKALQEEKRKRQERQVRDSQGNRWIKCEFCGKIAMESEFVTYGGPGRMNLGTCKECKERMKREKLTVQSPQQPASKMNPVKTASNICPQCGGELVERNGRYGRFMGCRNYPDCRYSRKL